MSDKTLNNTLIVFAKFPEPGKVKTRLAKDLGESRAAEIYSSMALDIISRVSRSGLYDTVIFYDPPEKRKEIAIWLGDCKNIKAEHLIPQTGCTLGERIAAAFQTVLSTEDKKAVIIGTDCTEVSAGIIEDSFEALREYDVLIGPSEDGGYYLLGLKSFIPELFQDIEWSTERVLEQTVNRIRQMGISHKLLEPLRDIDNIHDLKSASVDKILETDKPI